MLKIITTAHFHRQKANKTGGKIDCFLEELRSQDDLGV
jgi:hypothetical protein